MSSIAPNTKFASEEVRLYINQAVQIIKSEHLTASKIASNVKYITNNDGVSLVQIFADGAAVIEKMINTPCMTIPREKAFLKHKLTMMFSVHFLDLFTALKALSPELAAFGWSITEVKESMRNFTVYAGKDTKTDTPKYGGADSRIVLSLSPHLSVDNGADGLRVAPLCNNTAREGTPMIVNVKEEIEKLAKLVERSRRNRNGIDEDSPPSIVIPVKKTLEELIIPNADYAKMVAEALVGPYFAGGVFFARDMTWKEDATLVGDETERRCMTELIMDYSQYIDKVVRKMLPPVFFQITNDPKTNTTRFPSAYAQSIVLQIACEESTRLLANWSAIVENVAILVETAAPTMGWMVTSLVASAYNERLYRGKNAPMGGAAAQFIVSLKPNLVGAWAGKHPVCNNTAEQGFPMIVNTGRAPSGPYVNAARAGATQSRPTVTQSYTSSSGSATASGGSTAALRRTTVGATGRR